MMTRSLLLGLGLASSLVCACGSGDGAAYDAEPACTQTCVEAGWWLTVSSDCSLVCMANPSLPECTRADCDVVNAQRYASNTQRSLLLLHSEEARSFYLLVPPTSEPYSIEPVCVLQLGDSPPRSFTFTCSGAALTFQTAQFALVTAAQQGALDQASQSGAEGSYGY